MLGEAAHVKAMTDVMREKVPVVSYGLTLLGWIEFGSDLQDA